MILIKLGGSVITNKKKVCTFRRSITESLIQEIKQTNKRIILVHGAGSFGHIHADDYKLYNGYKSNNQIYGVSKVQYEVRKLNQKIVNLLIRKGYSAVSIPPSTFIICKNKKIFKTNLDLFSLYLRYDFTPVTFGDVVIDNTIGFCICSGDLLMRLLAMRFKPEKTIFVTDVDGVYTKNPKVHKDAKLIKRFTRTITKKIRYQNTSKIHDVTGSMAVKVSVCLDILPYTRPYILNGMMKNRLKDVINGKRTVCTVFE